MKLIWIFIALATFGWNYDAKAQTTTEKTGKVIITFTNVEVGKGLLRSALYGKEKFLKRDGELYDSKYPTTSSTMEVTYDNIPYGTYAIAAYQDKDEDAHLSKNWIGMPAEAYGFSKPLKSKWRVPEFEEIAFKLDSPEKRFEVRLDYWINH